jgi:putative ABC transport system permease protein
VASASDTPGLNQYSARTLYENAKGEMVVNFAKLYFVDHDFIDTYRIELVAGRGFSRNFPTDTVAAMIVNKRATRVYGFEKPEDIVGKRFQQWGREGVIVGVVEDFNFTSLHDPIRPFSMRIDPSETRFLILRLQSDDLQQTVADLEARWQALVPHRPFDFSFQAERLDRLYRAEARFGRVFGVFAGLALFIASLGLFGLASYTTARRTKEIGIRRILGATTPRLVLLLCRDFAVLVGVAFVVAVPLAFYGLSRWLDGFAYRIDLGAVPFLEAGALAFLIALASVGYRAARAASASPVESLRYE